MCLTFDVFTLLTKRTFFLDQSNQLLAMLGTLLFTSLLFNLFSFEVS